MRQTFTGLLLFCLTIGQAQTGKPELKFNKEGKFKIVQFTDVHFKYKNPASDIALERINEVLDAEKPDLVIFTGDIIYSAPAEKGMKTVLEPVADRRIPFGAVYGNHDDEQGMSREELLEVIESVPYNLTARTKAISGITNYTIPVKTADGKKTGAVLYCLDSHAYSELDDIKGYDFLKPDQILWYIRQSIAYTRKNAGIPLPSLAFFHIPLPEFAEAAVSEEAVLIGTRMEKVCAPSLNSGMFAAMKTMGDILGVFVGHDHNNDYAVDWKGILLAYGRYTGGNTVYNDLPNGARVIELKEGSRSFDTWIRLKDGETVNRVTYPDSFIKK